MGIVYDTTNNVNTTMLFKSKLNKNYDSENYWIESLQHKVDKAWDFTSDRVDVQEEILRYNSEGYIKADTKYDDIEVRITSAYNETGDKLTDDYKNIIYKDVQHNQRLGQKYYFDVRDFNQTDESKKSVWLNINFDTVKLGANALIRRCPVKLGFLIDGHTKEWYEPAIIDYNSKYTINYYNDVLNVVKSEVYLTLQYNEYTKSLKVNDRFIIGALDFDNISNNSVYKVKEVFRFDALETDHPNSIPLIILAMDRDIINPEVDLVALDLDGKPHYICDYYNEIKEPQDNKEQSEKSGSSYYVKCEPIVDTIYQGETQEFVCKLYNDLDTPVEANFVFSFTLDDTSQPGRYFSSEIVDGNTFKITNKYKFFKSDLHILCHCNDIENVEDLAFDVQLGEAL